MRSGRAGAEAGRGRRKATLCCQEAARPVRLSHMPGSALWHFCHSAQPFFSTTERVRDHRIEWHGSRYSLGGFPKRDGWWKPRAKSRREASHAHFWPRPAPFASTPFERLLTILVGVSSGRCDMAKPVLLPITLSSPTTVGRAFFCGKAAKAIPLFGASIAAPISDFLVFCVRGGVVHRMEICAEAEESGVTREETKALKDHIVRLYSERYTCRQIADLTGLSYRYVRDSLRERGIRPVRRLVRGSRGRRVIKSNPPEG